MVNILHKELSYNITGLCFKVHKKLGRFCRERQYADQLEQFLMESKISYLREAELSKLHSQSAKGNRVDFLIQGKIILLKAKNFVTKDDYAQMQRYLEVADLDLGLIVNFRCRYLKPKRILNGRYSGHSG